MILCHYDYQGEKWLITVICTFGLFSVLSRRVSRTVLHQIHNGHSSKIYSNVFNWLKNDDSNNNNNDNSNRPSLSKTYVILYLKIQGKMFEMQQFFIRQLRSVFNLFSQPFFL